MQSLNETHDPVLRSWVASANAAGTDFPIQNLPFAVFRRAGTGETFRGGVAIGDAIVDLAAALASGAFDGLAARAAQAAAGDSLNALMALGPDAWSALRLALSRALREGGATEPKSWRRCSWRKKMPSTRCPHASATTPTSTRRFITPPTSANSSGLTTRCFRTTSGCPSGTTGGRQASGSRGRPSHGRSGQTMLPGEEAPQLRPSRRLDYELEIGIFIGGGNAAGEPIAIADAESHVFGICLLNDWSARDIQAWEYQPLGPFLRRTLRPRSRRGS